MRESTGVSKTVWRDLLWQVFLIGFVVCLCRRRRSRLEHVVERDEFNDDSDDELIQP